MTFDFDKIRDDPQAAYVVGVVLGFALGFLIARRPAPKKPPWLRPLFENPTVETRIVEMPCSECAEKAKLEAAEGAHLES